MIVAVAPPRSSRIWNVPEKQKVYPNDCPGSRSPLSRKLCATSRTRARPLPVFVQVTRVPALMTSEAGLNPPPPPAMVIVVKLVGEQFGLGLGDGLGLMPGDGLGLGLGLGVCAMLAFAHNPIMAANAKVTDPSLRMFMRAGYRAASRAPKEQRLRS